MTSAEVAENIHSAVDGIRFCSYVILKARNEARLVNQILYTMLSAYTNNPINLAINSPPGEGAMFVAGMTDNRRGRLVIKNEVGEYETTEEKIAKIDSDIEEKESEVAASKNTNLKQARRNEIKELQQQKKDLYKNARKLIDLSHKIIVFQDTPNPGLLIALMPLHHMISTEYEGILMRSIAASMI